MSTAAGTRFQGGPSCEIFSPQGTDPLRKQGVGVHGRVGLEFEKSIKSYALVCNGGTTCKVDFPGAKAKRKNLALTQRYLAIQLSLPAAADPFGLELTVADAQRTRRRLVISSAFRNIVAHPLHVQLPLGASYEPHFGDREIDAERADDDTVVPRGIWLTLCLDMQELVASNFSGINFRALEALSISGTSKVRRVFTLKDPPPAMNMPVKPGQKLAPIPRQLQFLGTMETSPPTIFFTMAAVHAWEEVHGAEHRHSPRSQSQKLARTRRPGDRPPVSARSTSTLGAGSTTSATPRTRRLLQTRRAPEATPPETHDEEDTPASHGIDAAANNDEGEDDGSTILAGKLSSGETRGKTERILPALARAKQGVAQPTRPKFTLDLPIREERPSSRQDKSARSSRARLSARERRKTATAVPSTNQEQEEEEDIALNEYAANSPSSPVAAISRAQVTQGDAAVDSDGDGEFDEEDRPRGQSVETYATSLDNDDLADDDGYQTRTDDEEENNLTHNPRAPTDADADSSHGGDALSDNDEIFLDGGNDEIGADDLDASREEDDDLELSAALEPTSTASENRLRDRLVQEREELAQMEARIAAEEDKLLDARRREREADIDAVTDLSEHERIDGEESTAERDDLAALSEQVLQTTISDALQNLASTSEDSTNGQRTVSIDYASKKNAGKEKEEEEEEGDLDLVFDPILECYFCPKTNKYYKMK